MPTKAKPPTKKATIPPFLAIPLLSWGSWKQDVKAYLFICESKKVFIRWYQELKYEDVGCK